MSDETIAKILSGEETLEEMMARHDRENEELVKRADASLERLRASGRRETRIVLACAVAFLMGFGWFAFRTLDAEKAAAAACSERQCEVGEPMRVQLSGSARVCVCLQEAGQ